MKRFWLFLILCLFCVNSLCAALYGGAETLDDGSGFISFSPFIDMVFWGILIIVFAAAALFYWRRYRPGLPNIPAPLCFPAAYLATLAGLSVLILLLGICRVLDQYSPVHLPLPGYIVLMTALYLLAGFYWGKRCGGRAWLAVAWGVLITLILAAMGNVLIQEAHIREAPWIDQIRAGSYHSISPESLLEDFPGGILARLALPACLVMDNYYYAYVTLDGIRTILHRDIITGCVCLIPPSFFTISWLIGRRYHSSKTE